VRQHVVAGEAGHHGRLQFAPAGAHEWRDQVLPAFGLDAVVAEEARDRKRNLADASAADFAGGGGPV